MNRPVDPKDTDIVTLGDLANAFDFDSPVVQSSSDLPRH